jgi:predicted DNA-binding ribbon-helix-helix protein
MVNMPPPKRGKSLVIKRNLSLGSHKTSVGLEEAFWDTLKGIAASHCLDRQRATARQSDFCGALVHSRLLPQ